MFRKLISCLIVVCLTISQITFSSPVSAQSALLTVSTQGLMINGLIVHPENPLQFNFLFSQPETIENESALREDALKQIRYFLASLAIPENDLWVNLSPYEPDRIISNNLSQTEMGRDMLAQDYVLKQLTASLMSPESEQGKIFWDKIHHAAYEKFGVTEIPAEAFNKVWIVPNKSVVFENGGRVYVLESSLRVMLDQDYIAEKAQENRAFSTDTIAQGGDSLQTDLIRQVIAPEIERQINEGEQFATVRQIYHAVLLAAWFKKKLQKSLLGQLYVDQNKTSGIDLAGEADKQKIYNEYLQAFQSGAFDLIKEEYDPATQAMMPHKYFAGGLNLRNASPMVAKDAGVMKAMLVIPGLNVNVTFQSFKNFSLTLILLLAFVSCQNNNPKPAVAPEESIEQAAQDTGATSVNVPPQQGTKAVPPKKRPQAPAVSERESEPLGLDVNPLTWLENQGAQRDTAIEKQLHILMQGKIFALIWDSQGYGDVVYSVQTNDFDGIYTLLLFMKNNKDNENYRPHIRHFLENMWRFVTPKNKSVVFKFLTDVKNGHLLGANRQFTEGAEIGLYEMSQNNNKAMLFKAVGRDIENGGIDLKLENFEIHSTDAGIEFDFDPAMMQNIRFDGLVPVINGIEKSMNLRLILGLETGTPESNPDQNMSQELVAIKS